MSWWWEHGHRCHGAWVESGGFDQRIGFVGLTPPGIRPVVYSWSLDDVKDANGECSTLRAAKRRVDRAIREHYRWMIDAYGKGPVRSREEAMEAKERRRGRDHGKKGR